MQTTLDEVELPVYYVVSRGLTEEQATTVLNALSITPVCCAVISDIHDAPLALSLATEVIRVSSDDDAHVLAKKIWQDTKRYPVIVGIADFLDAFYANGAREQVVTHC